MYGSERQLRSRSSWRESLHFGIAQPRCREAYEASLQRMLDRYLVLGVGQQTARHYASIRLELKIAALCRQHAMPLRSRDVHFDYAAGLRRAGVVDEIAKASTRYPELPTEGPA